MELLGKLQRAVSDIQARAAKLNEDYRSRLARERLKGNAKAQDAQKAAAARTETLLQECDGREGATMLRVERRKARIAKAFQTSKEQRLKQIEDELGARKYEAQRRMLQAEKDREAGIAAASKHQQEFQKKLAEENERLATLEFQAQRAFAGYGGLKKEFFGAYQSANTSLEGSTEALSSKLTSHLSQAQDGLQSLRGNVLLRVFRPIWLWLVLALAILGVPFVLAQLGKPGLSIGAAAGAAAAFAALAILLRQVGLIQARAAAKDLSANLAQGRVTHDAAFARSNTDLEEAKKRLQEAYASTAQSVEQMLKRANAQAGEKRVSLRMRADEKTVRAGATLERLRDQWTAAHQKARHAAVLTAEKEAAEATTAGTSSVTVTQQQIEAELGHAQRQLEAEWKSTLQPLYAAITAHNARLASLFPAWSADHVRNWTPPAAMADSASIALAQIHARASSIGKPANLELPGPDPIQVRLALSLPQEGSLLIETKDWGHDEAVSALNNTILRLLSGAPAGRLTFTVLDPVGLGQNFAGVMHIADYEEQIINNRIWTQSTQIEQRLADLNEHMEKVIQMYLRNEYATIAEYNRQAGSIAEKYHYLVVADFPAGFTETSLKRLMSIAASGARCGVFMLIHWDRRLPLPQEFLPEELRRHCFTLAARDKGFEAVGPALPTLSISLEQPPAQDEAIELVHRIGKLSRDSSRVEVPFEHVAPEDDKIWSEETTTELRVPIGRTGATKLQYLAIGKGTCQHGLVAGKTGSGKSTLFHVIITNLALWCSPAEVEFYLVDFKKGVEFKTYATHRLPHARVIAIESDREFGLSVLERVDQELRRRGEMFRKLGAQDIPGYKRAGGKDSIPRTLLLIDEFQEFFTEDDRVSQTAALLLDRIVRQGRAFGVHVLLGSQTLGGAYTIARTTLGQMVIRIALQCNEADAYLIMDESNPAPRLLSRPGEGIYNDTAGSIEGNSPFQVVWLPESVRDKYLSKVADRVRAAGPGAGYQEPIVFEGNTPADVRGNPLLAKLLASPPGRAPVAPTIWLGAPNSIKGPTEVVFERQSGNNLLIVGQSDEAILAIMGTSIVALGAQLAGSTARVLLCDSNPAGSSQADFLNRIVNSVRVEIERVPPGEVSNVMSALHAEMRRRTDLPDAAAEPTIFVVINGLQKFARLKQEDDFSFGGEDEQLRPGAALAALATEGPRLGMHVILATDSYSSLTRFMSRKVIGEFEMRVLFQMSANDSASLIDSPKAGSLGLHRALLQNAKQGWLETFRPYALPDEGWIEEVAKTLGKRDAERATSSRVIPIDAQT